MIIGYSIDESVAELHPEFKVAFCIAANIQDYSDSEKELAEKELVAKVQTKYNSQEELESHYANALYNTFYKSMGLKPKRVSTPIKQASRVFSTGTYKSHHKAITLGMEMEYLTMVSFQVYDLDKVEGSIKYKLSDGTEPIINFHNEEKTCKKGELILVDSEAVLHSVYYGNNLKKSITTKTQNFLIRLMVAPGMSETELENAKSSLAQKIENLIFL